MTAEVESEVEGDGEVAFLAATVAGGMSGRVSLTVFAGVGNDSSSAPSQSHFFGGVHRGHQDGGSGGVEKLSQHLLKDPDTGIDGGKCTVDTRV